MKNKKKSTFFSDFKEFISKGNIMDLAVAVVIGGAFGKIVSSLVADIIMPLLGLISGGASLADKAVVLKEAEGDTPANLLKWGAFVQYIIDFILVALCIFIVLRIIKKAKEKAESLKKKEEEEAKEEEPAKPTPEEESAEALKEILEILKKNK